jgi:hypothetical protein
MSEEAGNITPDTVVFNRTIAIEIWDQLRKGHPISEEHREAFVLYVDGTPIQPSAVSIQLAPGIAQRLHDGGTDEHDLKALEGALLLGLGEQGTAEWKEEDR